MIVIVPFDDGEYNICLQHKCSLGIAFFSVKGV
jgi:hypothetical protein